MPKKYLKKRREKIKQLPLIDKNFDDVHVVTLRNGIDPETFHWMLVACWSAAHKLISIGVSNWIATHTHKKLVTSTFRLNQSPPFPSEKKKHISAHSCVPYACTRRETEKAIKFY